MAFPLDPLDVTVEIAPGADPAGNPDDWTWVDITSYVRLRDGIEITQGRGDESARVQPSRCVLRLDNRDGHFSPRNPLGQWYGQLARNTPLRVRVDPGTGPVDRYSGFVSSWPPRWDKSGRDASVPIEANGVLRRLGQGASPLRSALYRAIVAADPVAYWPLEDGQDASQLASAIIGHPPGTLVGAELSSDSTLASSAPLPVIPEQSGSNGFVFTVPANVGASSSQWQYEAFIKLDHAPASIGSVLGIVFDDSNEDFWELRVSSPSVGGLRLAAVVNNSLAASATIDSATDFFGRWVHVAIEMAESGGTVTGRIRYRPVGESEFVTSNQLSYSGSLGRITLLTLHYSSSDQQQMACGHAALFAGNNITAHWAADDGHLGESAHERIERLCTEESVAFTTSATSSEAMGPQGTGTLLDLLQECADADMGVLHESGFGLAYMSRMERYSRAVDLALDGDKGHLAEPPEPVDDDQTLRNDVTVRRKNGSLARYVDNDSVSAVGRYDEDVTINVHSDLVLAGHAAWRVHLGTVDAMRWPRLDLNLARSPELIDDWLACGVGSRVTVDNPPDQVLGETIDLIVEGYTEYLGYRDWRVTLNCSPASPWTVGVWEDWTLGRLDTEGSELDSAATETDTTLSVATTSGPMWTTDPEHAPWTLEVGGEWVRVDAVGELLSTNPWLENGITGWSAQNSGVTLDTSTLPPIPDAKAVLFIAPDGTSASGGVLGALTAVGTITPGEEYIACMWARSAGGWSDIRPCVDWHNADGSFLSSDLGSGFSIQAGEWTFLQQTFTAPANASRARVRARHGSTPPQSATWRVWGIRLIKVSASSPQTFTVTRAVNGISKSHAAGTQVRLAQPMVWAL